MDIQVPPPSVDARRNTCPSCGSGPPDPLNRYAHAHLMHCPSCDLVFAGLIPTDRDLDTAYDDYGHAWIDSTITRDRYRDLLRSFEPHRQTNRILDFGCGAGFFLEEARAAGWEVFGNEYSGHAIHLALAKGLDVRRGALADANFGSAAFDVATAFEVFEHLRDPVHEAAELARVLRPGGLLYGTTPNFNSLSRRLLGPRWNVIEYPEHLCYFTSRAIESWLRRSGFKPARIETTGLSVGRLRRSLGVSAPGNSQAETDEALRSAIEGSHVLARAKTLANLALSTAGLGDTLKVWFVRS
jgi:SAM-dependent methyltransferase